MASEMKEGEEASSELKVESSSMMEDKIEQNPQAVLANWRKLMETGNLQKQHFIDYFQIQSRHYFEPQPDRHGLVKCMFKENDAKEDILNVLGEWILGPSPKKMLEKINMEGCSQSVCGRVFKIGEPTYSCRECGMDSTCVLCVSCFKLSAHRYHKYKMCTSAGGGCCDCGDVEAWKKDPFCEHHLRAKENNELMNNVVTEDMKERCTEAFVAILSFCINYLEIETKASLECLDGDGVDDDNFCTMLYNDELHTFDQVIQTLTKVTNCPTKEANEIVASIDREGRAIVRCDTFNECNQLREAIERQFLQPPPANQGARPNQVLKVSVLHVRAVACQQYALQLLSWFQEFLGYHRTFRQVFAKVIMDKKAPYSIRHILEHDVKLWKSARTSWHRLLISGLLLEYDSKFALAEEFSRNYATIVQDFIADDHDHSFSIVSLSVQLFTVPSIAHYLIAREGIFHKLMHTFYHRSIEEFIQNKTLHFSKVASTFTHFRRSTYILYDLRYILSFKPTTWTDDLREGFIEGCKVLLRVLNAMQGMEAITRQTGNHMDYEPEWECAFNVHIKLANAITLILDWCGSDQQVLVKIYQMVQRYLSSNGFIIGDSKTHDVTICNHKAVCLTYDVTTKPVSIHLPLSRFFAGLYLHLGKYGLSYDTLCTLKRTPEELMQPILCTQAMIAQVHAGMWRRNGYSLLHQLYFYRTARCRLEMLDRDIVCMQIAASLIESNQYLIHILDKFRLLDWLIPGERSGTEEAEDDFVRQLAIVDEFLEFLIVVIGERFVPGISDVTEEGRTRKEIIQLLCIKPFSHSELSRCMTDSNGNELAMENVIDSLATFKMPQHSDSKGVYELREELYNEYNMYFYHYTKEEKSKSEETQRARRKAKGELVCCPPPKLPKLNESFVTIANLLQCDVMMTIINTVIERALNGETKNFQESHLQKVLHLIGYALQEEESGNYPFLTFCQNAQQHNLMNNLELLTRCTRIEPHRDFVLWVMRKFKDVQQLLNKSQSENMQVEEVASTDTSASVIEMKEDMSADDSATDASQQENFEKEIRSRLAAKRRAKILAQMQTAQKNFLATHAYLFTILDKPIVIPNEEVRRMLAANNTLSAAAKQSMDWDDIEQSGGKEAGATAFYSEACLGFGRCVQQHEKEKLKCILCFEEAKVSKDGPLLVYLAFVQKSKILRTEDDSHIPLHTSSCGHVMHFDCWQEYYNNEENKELRRPRRQLSLMISSMQSNSEFLCPYCRCMGNAVIPVTVPLMNYSPPIVVHDPQEVLAFHHWMDLMSKYGDKLQYLFQTMDMESYVDNIPTLSSVMTEEFAHLDLNTIKKLSQTIKVPEIRQTWNLFVQQYTKILHGGGSGSNSDNGLLYTWHSCIYTIQIMELYLRAVNKPLKGEMSIRHKSCLSGLIHLSSLYPTLLAKPDLKAMVTPIVMMMRTVFNQDGTSILEWDCFSKMVSLIFMLPNLLYINEKPSSIVVNGSIFEFYLLQVFFLAQMAKIVMLYEDKPGGSMEVEEEEDDGDCRDSESQNEIFQNIWLFYAKYNIPNQKRMEGEKSKCTGEDVKDGSIIGDETEDIEKQRGSQSGGVSPMDKCQPEVVRRILAHLRQEMRQFLRCSCLFFHFVTDVDFPDFLAEPDSDTLENMCRYLGLNPDFNYYFDRPNHCLEYLERFATHPDIIAMDVNTMRSKDNNYTLNVIPCTRPMPQLVELPEDYSDLINSVSDFTCPNDDRDELKTPTMCLVCGDILCGQSYCCQPEMDDRPVGTCTYHTFRCSAEVGIFLRIRDCQVIYLSKNKGCFVHPPYLDQYGETDMGLRRGNPLRLCRTRYSRIHLAWLDHVLHEEIARANESSSSSGTQWHLM